MVKPKFLIYVRFNDSNVIVYRCYNDDVFHVMGQILYTAICQIEYVQFYSYCSDRESFFKKNYILIKDFK